MKTRPLIAAALAIGTLVPLATPAQAGPLRALFAGRRHAHNGDKFQAALDKLNLTDDQKAKIKPITDNAKRQIQALKADKSLSTDDKKAQAKGIMQDAFRQIRPILTPAQQQQLQQMAQQARAKYGR